MVTRKKRIVSAFILVFILAVSFVSSAQAADITLSSAVVINSSNKSQYEGKSIGGTIPSSSYTGSSPGAVVVDGIELNLTIDGLNVDYSGLYSMRSGISLVKGAKLHLTVKGTNNLKAGYGGAGISVPYSCTLEITAASTGTLNATGGKNYGGGAGIGSIGDHMNTNQVSDFLIPQGLGDIVINGGTINTQGGTWYHYYTASGGAAGIGSSEYSGHTDPKAVNVSNFKGDPVAEHPYRDVTYINNITGSVTINGGTVNATGGYYAAGIGGGSTGTLQSITITGGTVTATGGDMGAAIGLGFNNFTSGSGTLTCPAISISGGNVTANGSIGYGEAIAASQNTGGAISLLLSSNTDSIYADSYKGSSLQIMLSGSTLLALDKNGRPTGAYSGTVENMSVLNGKNLIRNYYVYDVKKASDIQNGSISISSSRFYAGQTVSVTATPETGYEFAYLTVKEDNGTVTTIKGNSFVMPMDNVTVSAVFKKSLVLHTVTVNASENGTVTADKSSAYEGDTVTLTVTPEDDYHCYSLTVKDASENTIAVTNNSFTMPDSNVTISAVFRNANLNYYNVIVQTATHGTVTASTSSAYGGQTVGLTITPDDGYTLNRLFVLEEGGYYIVFSAVPVDSFVMPANNVTVKATFTEKSYPVTILPSEHGTVTASKNAAKLNEYISLTVTPDEDYELDTLSVKDDFGQDVQLSGYSFLMPAVGVNVTATFKAIPYYGVSINTQGNGTVTANKSEHIRAGEQITLTITPDTGYYAESLSVTDSGNNPVSTKGRTFTMPENNVSVNVVFKSVGELQPVTYLDENGDEQTAGSYTLLNDANTAATTWEGWYVADGKLTIDTRVTVSGTAHLLLKDGATLNIPQGIQVNKNDSLFIYGHSAGNGTLNAGDGLTASNTANAGIGGTSDTTSTCGTITICGGTINATGGTKTETSWGTTTTNGGAGIGGGYNQAGNNITIRGGTVKATGGAASAGIGGGYGKAGGNITITGGNVEATAGEPVTSFGSTAQGAGIGGSSSNLNNATILLGWTNSIDSIKASSYGGTVSIKDGQFLTDGTNSYAGTLTDDHKTTAAGKTLTPDTGAHKITLGLVAGGSVHADKNVAHTGDTVNVIADSGYRLISAYCNGQEITIDGGIGTFTMPNNEVVITAVAGYSQLLGATGEYEPEGTGDKPFIISSVEGWNLFCDLMSAWNGFSGKFLKLGSDIAVTTMAGADTSFSGTFDGGGHVLNVNITNEDGTSLHIAPFRYINNAVIKNLTVDGEISSNSMYTGGLVGKASGTNTIESCIVKATLTLKGHYAGGIVAYSEGVSTTTIRDCVFAGKFVGNTPEEVVIESGSSTQANNVGGIWGNNGNVSVINCLEFGTFENIGSMNPIVYSGSSMITNSYYTNGSNDSAKKAYKVSGSDNIMVILDGEHGVTYGEDIYAGGGDVIALYISSKQGGKALRNCTASLGTLTADTETEGKYSLTMPESPTENITISAEFKTLYNVGISDSIVNGIVTPSKAYAAEGETITLTLTLYEGYEVSGVAVDGTAITPANGVYSFTMPARDVTVTATFSVNTASWGRTDSYTPDGTSANPYVISTLAGWELLVNELTNGNSYSGKVFNLSNDLEVTTMLGTNETGFAGTFEGNGKTLTFNYDGADDYVAPFRNVNGGTIKDLTVSGTIKTSGEHVGGIVGQSSGNTTIEACKFVGKLLTTSASGTIGGGFVAENNGTLTISKSLYAPATIGTDETEPSADGSATFARNNGEGTSDITNSYYLRELGMAQGTKAYSVTASEGITVTLVENSAKGFIHDERIYAGSGEIVSLTISGGNTKDGYTFKGYAASAGTLTESEGKYSLTMPAANVTISANFAENVSYKDANGNDATTSDYTVMTSDMTNLTAGTYVVKESVTVSALTLGGDVNLILCDGATLTVTEGVSGANSLVIYGQTNGTGTLTAITITLTGNKDLSVYGGTLTTTGAITIAGTVTVRNATVNGKTYDANGDSTTSYTVTFDSNGGSAVTSQTLKFKYGETVKATKPTDPTRDNYGFVTWLLNDKTYDFATVVSRDITLTADWAAIVYDIEYLGVDGATNNNPTSYTVEDEITLTEPTKNGSTFAGWTGTGLSAATKSVTITKGSTGKRTYTATWTGGGSNPDPDAPTFTKHSLVLNGMLGMNFFMNLPSGVDYNDGKKYYMEFNISGDTKSNNPQQYDATFKNVTGEYYGFRCYVKSIQMANKITATFHYDGKSVSHDYTVKEYLDGFYAEEGDTTALGRLAAAIKDYGHYVQPVLSETNGWKLGTDYAVMDCVHTYTDADIQEARTGVSDKAIVRDTGSSGIEKVTFTLELDSDTTLDIFLVVPDDCRQSLSVTYNGGGGIGSFQPDGRYKVQISDIAAHQLGDTYTIGVSTSKGSFNIEVSALSYVHTVLNGTNETDEMKKAVTALYKYYKATLAYRDENN